MAVSARARIILAQARQSSDKLAAHYDALAAEATRQGKDDRASYYAERAKESRQTVTRCDRIIASPRVMVR